MRSRGARTSPVRAAGGRVHLGRRPAIKRTVRAAVAEDSRVDEPAPLHELVAGEVVDAGNGARAFVVTTALDELPDPDAALLGQFQHALEQPSSSILQWIAAQSGCGTLGAATVCLVDLETTGLHSGPLFLIGTISLRGGRLCITQYLARDYSEERGAIALFAEDLTRHRLLITFNGAAYDLPYLRMRAAACGIGLTLPDAHLDLLFPCRRAFGPRLPDCRLRTLQAWIVGRDAFDDIPGADIPDAYHHFVRTGDATILVRILRHNILDLLTMVGLLIELSRGHAAQREDG